MEKIRDAKNFDELLDIKYGEVGTEKREVFESGFQSISLSIGESESYILLEGGDVVIFIVNRVK